MAGGAVQKANITVIIITYAQSSLLAQHKGSSGKVRQASGCDQSEKSHLLSLPHIPVSLSNRSRRIGGISRTAECRATSQRMMADADMAPWRLGAGLGARGNWAGPANRAFETRAYRSIGSIEIARQGTPSRRFCTAPECD